MDLLCRIEMFGQLKVTHGDRELTRFRTQKIGGILAYLALHRDQSVPRERLLDLFWPEMDLDAGRGNLNNALSSLRRHLDLPGFSQNGVLLADRQSVRLDTQTVRTDVQEFEELLREASRSASGIESIPRLERAAALYRGGLLPGYYDEWAIAEQQRLHRLYADALGFWSDALEKSGKLSTALSVIQDAIQSDIYREEFYRRKMRLQAALGQSVAALETYRQIEQRFETDLNAAPSLATRELARRIREAPTTFALTPNEPEQRILAAVAPTQDDKASPPSSPAAAVVATTTESPVSSLPLMLTRYFGRTYEREQLVTMLSGEETRLLTVLGPGGAGKTRIALEVARQVAPVFAGRVWWLSLADLPDARLLSSTLTRALRIPDTNRADPLESAIALLNEAPSLLVLDNFEHLLRGAAFAGAAKGDQTPSLDAATALVRLLLERAPRLCCLITSRHPLRLSGEQEYPLPALPVPAVSSLPTEVLTSPSVALYVDRARLVRPDFAVTANNAEAVARLCRKLEGMPLAIEMAAAWAKVLPPAKMLERLEERLDALTGRRQDLPPRHQSLRATIDWSYDLLDAPQKRLLTRLSVFRGGWSLEAAERVCATETDLENEVSEHLTSLVDKSLVVWEEGDAGEGHYRFLEVVRQYSQDRLQESGEAPRMRSRHFAYFRTMAEESWSKVRGPEQVACLNQLEREHDNMRAALAWSRTEEGRQQAGPEAELDLAGRLRPFWDMRNYWREGRRYLEAALESVGVAKTKPTEVLALALLGAGLLANNMADRAAARLLCEESLRICQQLGDTQGLASVTTALGTIARNEGDFAAAHRWYEQSMDAVRSTNDTFTLAILLGHLGVLAEKEKDLVAQQRYMEESLALSRQLGDPLRIAIMQNNLSSQFMERKDFPASYAAMEESLTILREVGDQRFTALTLEGFAFGEFLHGRIANGVRFIAAARRIRDEIGAPPNAAMERNLIEAQGDLGNEAFASALAAGRALDREQAIEEALESIAIIRREKI